MSNNEEVVRDEVRIIAGSLKFIFRFSLSESCYAVSKLKNEVIKSLKEKAIVCAKADCPDFSSWITHKSWLDLLLRIVMPYVMFAGCGLSHRKCSVAVCIWPQRHSWNQVRIRNEQWTSILDPDNRFLTDVITLSQKDAPDMFLIYLTAVYFSVLFYTLAGLGWKERRGSHFLGWLTKWNQLLYRPCLATSPLVWRRILFLISDTDRHASESKPVAKMPYKLTAGLSYHKPKQWKSTSKRF